MIGNDISKGWQKYPRREESKSHYKKKKTDYDRVGPLQSNWCPILKEEQLSRLPAFWLDPKNSPCVEYTSSSPYSAPLQGIFLLTVWIYLPTEIVLDLSEPWTLGKPWQSGYLAHPFMFWETANSKSALSYLAYRKLKRDHLVASTEFRHRQSKFSSCCLKPELPVSISPSGWLRLGIWPTQT